MKIEEIKKALLEDKNFKEEIAKYINDKNCKRLDELIAMKIDGEKVGQLIAPSIKN